MIRTVRDREAGITLIEVLVVLAVIGVAAGAMMIGIGDRGHEAQTEAVRLAVHLTLGVDEAMISGRPLALQWDAAGYTFAEQPAAQVQTDAGDWPPALLPVLGTRHDLSGGVALRLRDATTPGPVVIAVSGAAQTVTFDIVDEATSWKVTFDGLTAHATPEAGS